MPALLGMAILAVMSSDETEGKDRPDGNAAKDSDPAPDADSGGPASDDRDDDGRRASDDLAEGLELMLRAARKAVRDIDTARIEKLGRRARESLENINPKKVEEIDPLGGVEKIPLESIKVNEGIADKEFSRW